MTKYDSPLHIVSAYASELSVPPAQKSVEGKSNPIPAVQELIKTLEINNPDVEPRGIKTSTRISGCIVVADVMNCHIETAKVALEAKATYIL